MEIFSDLTEQLNPRKPVDIRNERLYTMSITDTLIGEEMEKDNKARIMNTAKRMIWVTFRKEGIPIFRGIRRSNPYR